MTAAPWATHHAGGRWLAFRNDSGETIPPFAVLRITGVVTIEGRAVLTVAKPNADGGTFYAVNGAVSVVSGGYGSCTRDAPCMAACDDSVTPSVGEEWGVMSASWELQRGYGGYRVIGVETGDNDRALVVRSDDIVRFELYATLSKGGSALAKPVYWNGSAYTAIANTITVYDFVGSLSGVVGNRGYGRWFSDRAVVEVLQIHC